jgi:serine/threonine protein kinase
LYSWYAFKAPEIDNDFYHDKSVDLWSLGATIYMLVTGLPPFRGNGNDLIENKQAGKVEFDMVIPSREAQDLIEGLLQVNQKSRFTVERVLRSAWMRQSDASLRRHDLSLAKTIFKDWNCKPYAS